MPQESQPRLAGHKIEFPRQEGLWGVYCVPMILHAVAVSHEVIAWVIIAKGPGMVPSGGDGRREENVGVSSTLWDMVVAPCCPNKYNKKH